MAETYWYFDGSAGCEVCGEMTGRYSEPPGRPHQNCNCEIREVVEEVVCALNWTDEERYLVNEVKEYIAPGPTPSSWWVMIYREYEVHRILWHECCWYENGVNTGECYDDLDEVVGAVEADIRGPILETEV